MPLIFIAVLALFLFVAPKLFKILLTIHIITAVVAFFVLLFLGGIGGALRGGPNAGLYEEEAIYLLLYIYATVGTMLLGIVAGIIVKIFADE